MFELDESIECPACGRNAIWTGEVSEDRWGRSFSFRCEHCGNAFGCIRPPWTEQWQRFENYRNRRLVWMRTFDVRMPWRTVAEGRVLTLRLNDFPDKALYTLFEEGTCLGHCDDWPASWVKVEV